VNTIKEGLGFARLMMVLSGMAPLFILWALRWQNVTAIPTAWFLGLCAILIIIPNLVLWARIRIARKNKDYKTIRIGKAEDHREHILVYLFAMLLPFYSVSIITCWDLATHLAAISFVVFLFWHLNMHYMNIWWAIRRFRIFTSYSENLENAKSGVIPFVVITRRHNLSIGQQLKVLRISDTVYLEVDE
jgi:hypothetical protein